MADDSDLSVRFGATTDGLNQGFQRAREQVATVPAAVANAQRQIASASDDVGASFAAMAEKADQASQRIRHSLQQTGGAAQSAGRALAASTGGAAAATEALDKVAHSSTRVRRELIVMAHEAVTNRWTRLAGSMMVLAEAGGVAAAIFNPLTLAIGGTALALAGLEIVAAKNQAQFRAFDNAMQATNGYAGLTASKFEEMSERIASSTHTGLGSARSAMIELVNGGQFTGQTIEKVAEASQRMATLTGESADKFREQFDKMGSKVAEFAAEFEAHYHLLTAAQYEHIQKLQEEGRTAEAQKAFFDDLLSDLGSQTEKNVGYAIQLWDSLKGAVQGVLDAVAQFGAPETTAQKIAGLQSRIAEARSGNLGAHGEYGPPQDTSGMEAELKALQMKLGIEERIASHKAAQAALQTDATEAAKRYAEKLARAKEDGSALEIELAKIRQDHDVQVRAHPENKANFDAEEATLEADARRRLTLKTPKTPKPKGEEDAFGLMREDLDGQVGGLKEFSPTDAAQKEVEFWEQKLATARRGSTEYHQIFFALNAAQNELEKDKAADQIAADKQRIEKADVGNDPQAHAQAWAAYFADLSKFYKLDAAKFTEAQTERQRADDEFKRKTAERAVSHDQSDTDSRVGAAEGSTRSTDASFDNQRRAVEANAQTRVTAARVAAAQLMAIDEAQKNYDVQAEQATQAIREQGFDQEVSHANNVQSVLDGVAKQREASETASAKRIADIQARYAQKAADDQVREVERIQQVWSQRINSMTQTVGQGFLQMARGSETFSQFAIQLAGSVESAFVNAAAKQVASWIENMAISAGLIPAQAAATNLPQIEGAAAVAAANAFAATAAIPVIGPEMAPGAAEAAYMEVMTFAPLASAAGGQWQVPFDGQLTELHKNEMVIPASHAAGLRAAIAGMGSGGDGPAAPGMSTGRMERQLGKLIDQHAAGSRSAQSLSRTVSRVARKVG